MWLRKGQRSDVRFCLEDPASMSAQCGIGKYQHSTARFWKQEDAGELGGKEEVLKVIADSLLFIFYFKFSLSFWVNTSVNRFPQ